MRIISNPATQDPRDWEPARSASGHACIRCGCSIYRPCTAGDDPAQDGFLLCPPCIDLLNAMPDNAKVLRVLRDHPLPRQAGFDRRPLPYGEGLLLLDTRFAFGVTMRQTVMPVLFGGPPVIMIEPPKVLGGPLLLTITLGDGQQPVTIVRENEWVGEDGGWRFDRHPGRYFFTGADGEASLVLAFPGTGVIVIESLRTRFGGHLLEMDARCARVDGAIVRIPSADSQIVGVRLPTP